MAIESSTARASDAPPAPARSAQSVWSGTLRAVLVEGDPDDALPLAEMLKDDATITVVHVSTLAEAMSVIPAVGEPSCLLLGLSLADADGCEGLIELRRFAPHAAAIVLTGRDDTASCFRAMAEGAEDYLVKGRITGEILRRSIRYAVERRSAETALLDANQRFHLAFEHSPTGIALLSVRPHQHGVVLEANPAFAAMLGRPLDTVVGADIVGLVDPRDVGRFALELQSIAAGEGSRADSTYTLIGEPEMPALCRITGSLLPDCSGTGECALLNFENITADVRRQEALGQALMRSTRPPTGSPGSTLPEATSASTGPTPACWASNRWSCWVTPGRWRSTRPTGRRSARRSSAR